MQQIDIKHRALVQGGMPDDDQTRALAQEMVLSQQPNVISTGMNLPYHTIQAGAAALQAGTAAEDATTKRMREKREQAKEYRDALFYEKEFNSENRAALAKARKADADAKRDVTSADSEEAKILRRIEDELLLNYPLLAPKKTAPKTDSTPNTLSDKKPEPKKKDAAAGWGELKVK